MPISYNLIISGGAVDHTFAFLLSYLAEDLCSTRHAQDAS